MTNRNAAVRTCMVALLLIGVPAVAAAQVQITLDGKHNLVQKDVGDERWAITYDLDDRTATGNVFFPAGGDPAFISCQTISEKGEQASFECYGAEPCANYPCSRADWTLIDTVDLPLAFFYPPNTPCQQSEGGDCRDFAGCCDTNASCVAGTCQLPCQPDLGESCTGQFSGCCNPSYSCSNGSCTIGLCFTEGFGCTDSTECCPGLDCLANTCATP